MSELLKINSSLRILNLSGDEEIRTEMRVENEKNDHEKWIGNKIRDEGAEALSESLKINTSLTELDLSGDENIRKKDKKWKEW